MAPIRSSSVLCQIVSKAIVVRSRFSYSPYAEFSQSYPVVRPGQGQGRGKRLITINKVCM